MKALPPPTAPEPEVVGAAAPHQAWTVLGAWLAAKSENTQTGYLRILRRWAKHLGAPIGGDPEPWLRATADDVRAWLLALRERPGVLDRSAGPGPTSVPDKRRSPSPPPRLAPKTIRWSWSVLKVTYAQLVRAQLADRNPFDDAEGAVPRAGPERRPTNLVPFHKVAEIVHGYDGATPRSRLYRALWAGLFGSGCRISEMLNLRASDVREEHGNLVLYLRTTKARKAAHQYVAEPLGSVLREWAAEVRAERGPDAYIFSLLRGAPMGREAAFREFRRACARVGVSHVSPHSARATAITALLADGTPWEEVRNFARHSSLTITEKYDKRMRSGLAGAKRLRY